MKTKLKTNDQVVVISGADRGKRGKILAISAKNGKVIVEGVNKKNKYIRASQENPKGGMITREYPVHISSIMYFCDKCKKGVRVQKITSDGKDTGRTCSKCGKSIDK